MKRADKIVNPIGSLTDEEKERLGLLVMWALDGPEQGFLDTRGYYRIQWELFEFFAANGIHAGGQWSQIAKDKKDMVYEHEKK